MIRVTVALGCDWRTAEGCWSLDPYRVPVVANSAALARSRGREFGWHRADGREDVCPECWSRRVRYRAGRPLTRH